MLSSKILIRHYEIYHIDNFFSIITIFFIKKSFKGALQYLLNVFIQLNAVFNLKINLKLKIDPKMCTFENLEEFLKSRKKTCQKHLATLFLAKNGDLYLLYIF